MTHPFCTQGRINCFNFFLSAALAAPSLFNPIKSNYPQGTYYSAVPILLSFPFIPNLHIPHLHSQSSHPFASQLRINWISYRYFPHYPLQLDFELQTSSLWTSNPSSYLESVCRYVALGSDLLMDGSVLSFSIRCYNGGLGLLALTPLFPSHF